MENLRSIVARFPRRELDIRRRFIRDEQFRGICADYEETMRALRHWQPAASEGDPEGSRNAADREQVVAELKQEALAHLNEP
ncbi:hypothetical protein [Bradyrhizobium sp. ORS 111]|uniref:hypothetical protein n=1 Tax=Bradyrhizobium sp. ORS 111 TaxID=1685958 RepID=UPI00388D3EDB